MTNPRLEELRAKFHENPRRYFAPYANELRKTGDAAQAIAVCRTHLASQPGHVSGHIVLGQALYEAGEANEARDIFTAALELDPENLIALRSLGEIAQVNGDFGGARQWYQRLLDADPRSNEVAQLLRDIPAEAPAKPLFTPEPEPAEEPTPFTVREEVAAAEATPSLAEPAAAETTPRVHTGFTGQGPAYKTAEDEGEEAPAKQADEAPLSETEDAFINLQPSAHDHGVHASDDLSEAVSASTESEPMETVDLGEETEVFAAGATQEAMPDDSFDAVEAAARDVAPEFSVESEYSYAPEPSYEAEPNDVPEAVSETESGFETVETYTNQSASDALPPLEIEDFAADALTPDLSKAPASSDEASEPPRAVFAERGFDGSVDEMGWMTTPSQAFSDLEAAPEDWLEEAREEEPVAESSDTEPTAAANSPDDHATDSWFDEAPGATIEATEVNTDELWLPPELPQVTNAELNPTSRTDAGASAEAPTDVPAWSASAEEVPNATESEWAPPAESLPPADYAETAESSAVVSSYAQAEADVPDETAQSVDAESEQEISAMSEHVGVDATPGEEDVRPVEVSASAAETEPTAETSEYEEHHLDDAPPEFVYASESGTTSSSGSAIGQTPTDAVSAATPAPFLTETLAELYLQQGFRDEALSIYRQLLDRNPTDSALKSRIATLEHAELTQPAPLPSETRAASQSVRTFFSRLARRSATAPHATGHASGGGGGDSGGQPDVPFSVAASALANLFSASKPPQADEGAASTLAGAFTDPAGRPSRAAERELSLDHLFRDVAPGGPATGGVTLDEFYSAPNSGTGSSTESGSEAGAEDPSGTDIRQFTAWLEGLRKK
jgi:tetratricopeptide (TPR) repeat protein